MSDDRPQGEGWEPWPSPLEPTEHARVYRMLDTGQKLEVMRPEWEKPHLISDLPQLMNMSGLWWRVPLIGGAP